MTDHRIGQHRAQAGGSCIRVSTAHVRLFLDRPPNVLRRKETCNASTIHYRPPPTTSSPSSPSSLGGIKIMKSIKLHYIIGTPQAGLLASLRLRRFLNPYPHLAKRPTTGKRSPPTRGESTKLNDHFWSCSDRRSIGRPSDHLAVYDRSQETIHGT